MNRNKFDQRGVGTELALLSISKVFHPESFTPEDQKRMDKLQDYQWDWEQGQEREESWWDGEEDE